MSRWTTRCLALALAAIATPARGGELRGTATYAGPAPRPAPEPVTKDKAACGESQPDESLLVANGRLANVVVQVKGAPSAPAALVLGQERCRYRPHVLAAPVGSTLAFDNGDPLLHNVHGYRGRATAFNVAMPQQGRRSAARKLDRPGVVRVRCDVHGWMSALVLVAEGPTAVTAADGSFAIKGLPPGTWTVTAWHERLGERTAQVTVPADGAATASFRFE
ncbi:MAG TPA: carboxypeptidase regulatory-like domain-containing protein [Anaeromyxobacteraceae bacterium]|jgi:plastocyanin|nr:carboxypeptidase regulatory-like domain-containing protein [Anaeromyxobacteraceae bacterium]